MKYMKADIHLTNGNTLHLDEYATDQILKLIHKQEMGNSLLNLHVAEKTGELMYSIPMTNIVYIEYLG